MRNTQEDGEPVTRYYTDLHPAEADRSRWTVVHALRDQAGLRSLIAAHAPGP